MFSLAKLPLFCVPKLEVNGENDDNSDTNDFDNDENSDNDADKWHDDVWCWWSVLMMADNDDIKEKEEKDKEKVNDIKNRRPSDRKRKRLIKR